MDRIRPIRLFYVYALFRPDTGDVCYIGKGCENRWLMQIDKSHSPILARIIQKYGALIPVKIREGLVESAAYEIEAALIAALGRRCERKGPLANLSVGGEKSATGSIRSEESRARYRASRLGKRMSLETKARLATVKTGTSTGKRSEEWKKAHSLRLKGRVFTPTHLVALSVVARKRGHNGRRGPYPEFHKDAIARGVSDYWRRYREDPTVRLERQRKIAARRENQP